MARGGLESWKPAAVAGSWWPGMSCSVWAGQASPWVGVLGYPAWHRPVVSACVPAFGLRALLCRRGVPLSYADPIRRSMVVACRASRPITPQGPSVGLTPSVSTGFDSVGLPGPCLQAHRGTGPCRLPGPCLRTHHVDRRHRAVPSSRAPFPGPWWRRRSPVRSDAASAGHPYVPPVG